MKKAILFSTIIGACAFAIPANADSFSVGNVSIQSDQNLQDTTLTISGPNGFYQQQRQNAGGVTVQGDQGAMPDGQYNWQLSGHNGNKIVTAKDKMNNGRGDAERGFSYETVVQSGTFTVQNGVKVDQTLIEK